MNSKRIDFLERVAALRAGAIDLGGGALHIETCLRPAFLPNEPIEHTEFLACASTIASAHVEHLNSGESTTARIVGQSGCGKSFLRDWYCARNPIEIRSDFDRIPVITVETPTRPTVKGLATELLRALNCPVVERGTEYERTHRLYRLLEKHCVEMIIIDEFHHFVDHPSPATTEVTDWLKLLVNACPLTVVLIGLPRSEQIIHQNEQMRRRFSRCRQLKPFSATNESSWLEFRAVLKELHRRCPVTSAAFHEPDLARRFLFATEGLIDYAVRIINGAISLAQITNRTIDQHLLAQAFLERVWNRAPDDLNPFIAEGDLRSLRQEGEPFELWDSYGT